MNKFPFAGLAPRPCPWVAFLLLVALPGPTLAQKPVPPPPAAAPAASPPAAPSLALGPKEALSQKQMLDADKRLDRPVTLDVISVPLDEVLQKESINKSADAKPAPDRLVLTASHNCEALKLQIHLNKRPLRVLMIALAEMLPGMWTRSKEGYNLSLTDKAVIARAEWWRLFLGERDKALALERQAVLSAMQTKARRRQLDDPEPEPSDHAVEEEMANQHDFFFALPQALKEQIAANLDDGSFYEVGGGGFANDGETGTVGWLSQMPPETQEKFKAAMQDNITNHLAGAPPALQKYATQAQRDLAAFDPSRVYFLFQNGGFVVYATPFNGPSSAGGIELHVPSPVNTVPLSLDQTALADMVYGGADVPLPWKRRAAEWHQGAGPLTPDQQMLVYQVYGMGEAAPTEWKQLAAYQRGRVWPNTLPKVSPEFRGGTRIISMKPVISRAAQTDWLGEQGHMEYVSDYYSHGGYSMPEDQRKLPVKRPLATEMDEMAAKRDVSWKRDADGITLIRNNRWYRDDNLEVPQPLLRRWFNAMLQARRQETAAQAAPQSRQERAAALKQNCDWAVEVYSTLTPWQIRNGLALFQPEEKDLAPQNDATATQEFEKMKQEKPRGTVPPDDNAFMTRTPPFWMAIMTLNRYPHTIHLYGSLDDAGRTALLVGRLPVSALTPEQLTEATSLLPLLPQALQSLPADSVLLALPDEWSPSSRAVFGAVPFTKLAVRMSAPPSAP